MIRRKYLLFLLPVKRDKEHTLRVTEQSGYEQRLDVRGMKNPVEGENSDDNNENCAVCSPVISNAIA
jgi:hypothetical protein